MYFRQILHEDHSCASYIVGCPTLGAAVVVDPQGDPAQYVERVAAGAMTITGVIETHLHADHVSCARELAVRTNAPLYLGPGARVGYPHETLSDGQILQVGNRRIRVLHTPGHTPEHVTLVVDDWFALTGDTLFVGDVGRVDLALEEIGDDTVRERARALYDSVRRILELPDWTELYPGHFAGSVCGRGMDGKPVSTVGRERRKNRALQLSRTEFLDFQTTALPPLPADFHAIKRANLGI